MKKLQTKAVNCWHEALPFLKLNKWPTAMSKLVNFNTNLNLSSLCFLPPHPQKAQDPSGDSL